jgi:endonuclease YncB( thermonuclease family)
VGVISTPWETRRRSRVWINALDRATRRPKISYRMKFAGKILLPKNEWENGHMMRVLAGAVGLIVTAIPVLAHDPIIGKVTHIEDGGTFCVGTIKVRLEGIDAPETNEDCWRNGHRWKCGRMATQKLREVVEQQTVTCEPKYCDARDRTVAVCRLSSGDDIGAAMVSAGWAIDWPHYSGGRYRWLQDGAHLGARGLWSERGGPTWRMWRRMWLPLGSRRERGPWPPCKKRCDTSIATDQGVRRDHRLTTVDVK